MEVCINCNHTRGYHRHCRDQEEWNDTRASYEPIKCPKYWCRGYVGNKCLCRCRDFKPKKKK